MYGVTPEQQPSAARNTTVCALTVQAFDVTVRSTTSLLATAKGTIRVAIITHVQILPVTAVSRCSAMRIMQL